MSLSSDTSAFSKPRPGLTALANPTRFLAFTKIVMPWLTAATVITLAIGLFMSFNVPDDYQQGRTVRIMFVHVPSVWVAMAAYMTMVSGALGVLVWRHPLADVAARAAAPIGATFTFLGLATGSIWGRPMWGTWWEWAARLTTFLIPYHPNHTLFGRMVHHATPGAKRHPRGRAISGTTIPLSAADDGASLSAAVPDAPSLGNAQRNHAPTNPYVAAQSSSCRERED